MRYWLLSSRSMDPWTIEKADADDARRTWLCTGCAAPKPGVGPVSFRVQGVPKKLPLNLDNGTGVTIASRELIAAFGDAAARDLMIGDVFDDKGRKLEDWATVIGKHRTVVRGKNQAQWRRCGECGRILYFSLDQAYLSPAPDPNVAIFDAGNGWLVINEVVHNR